MAVTTVNIGAATKTAGTATTTTTTTGAAATITMITIAMTMTAMIGNDITKGAVGATIPVVAPLQRL
jgi:hypothetical protein